MKNFIEIQNWGFNTLIISSFLTLAFGVFQGYGFFTQSQKIWKRRSTESVSTTYFSFLFFYFIAFTIYGLSKNSLAMSINGLLFIPCAYIVIGIVKFKKLNWKDYLSFMLSATTIPIMIFTDEKDLFLFIMLMASMVTMIIQLITMISNKSSGSVEFKFLIVFFTTAIFWLIYAIIVNNWPLIVFNIMAIIIYGSMSVLYKKYE